MQEKGYKQESPRELKWNEKEYYLKSIDGRLALYEKDSFGEDKQKLLLPESEGFDIIIYAIIYNFLHRSLKYKDGEDEKLILMRIALSLISGDHKFMDYKLEELSKILENGWYEVHFLACNDNELQAHITRCKENIESSNNKGKFFILSNNNKKQSTFCGYIKIAKDDWEISNKVLSEAFLPKVRNFLKEEEYKFSNDVQFKSKVIDLIIDDGTYKKYKPRPREINISYPNIDLVIDSSDDEIFNSPFYETSDFDKEIGQDFMKKQSRSKLKVGYTAEKDDFSLPKKDPLDEELCKLNECIKSKELQFPRIKKEEDEVYFKIKEDKWEKLNKTYKIAQFRGINYILGIWGDDARREHRKLNEKNHAYYSENVLNSVFDDVYNSFSLEALEQYSEDLSKKSQLLSKFLLSLREESRWIIEYNPGSGTDITPYKLYSNFLNWFQNIYSNGIIKSLSTLREMSKKYSFPTENSYNPFISTSDLIEHALRYAFGLKNPYQSIAMKPKYNNDGKPKKPCIGKVEVILQDIYEYLNDTRPNIIRVMNQSTEIYTHPRILPEFETSFLSYLPKGSIILDLKIIFPDFSKKYDNGYFEQFGINLTDYNKFKEILKADIFQFESQLYKFLHNFYRTYISKFLEKLSKENQNISFIDNDGFFTNATPKTPSSTDKKNKKRTIAKDLHKAGKLSKPFYSDDFSRQDGKKTDYFEINEEVIKNKMKEKQIDFTIQFSPTSPGEKNKSPLDEIIKKYSPQQNPYNYNPPNSPTFKNKNIQATDATQNNNTNILKLQEIQGNEEISNLSNIFTKLDLDATTAYASLNAGTTLAKEKSYSSITTAEEEANNAALYSQRLISHVMINEETLPSITIAIAPNGNCGFAATEHALKINGMNDLAEHVTRFSFIKTVKNVINELNMTSESNTRSEKLSQLIKAIYEVAHITEFDLTPEKFTLWKNHFNDPTSWAHDIHFSLISYLYGIRFEFYVIDLENNDRLIPRGGTLGDASIIQENILQDTIITIRLLHNTTAIVNLSAAEPNNHFDLLYFNPANELKARIRKLGYTIIQEKEFTTFEYNEAVFVKDANSERLGETSNVNNSESTVRDKSEYAPSYDNLKQVKLKPNVFTLFNSNEKNINQCNSELQKIASLLKTNIIKERTNGDMEIIFSEFALAKEFLNSFMKIELRDVNLSFNNKPILIPINKSDKSCKIILTKTEYGIIKSKILLLQAKIKERTNGDMEITFSEFALAKEFRNSLMKIELRDVNLSFNNKSILIPINKSDKSCRIILTRAEYKVIAADKGHKINTNTP